SLGGVRGDRVREVARRGACHRVEAELPSLAHGHRDDPVLEGPRGVADRVVLEVKLADAPGRLEVPRAHERGQSHVVTDRGLPVQRQEVLVAPDAGWARRDPIPGQDRADGGVVVVDLEGTEAVLADVGGTLWNAAATLAANKPADEGHEPGPPGDLSPTQRNRVPDADERHVSRALGRVNEALRQEG